MQSDAAFDRDAFRESENHILLDAHVPIENHIGTLYELYSSYTWQY
jgi:hypothetical protein